MNNKIAFAPLAAAVVIGGLSCAAHGQTVYKDADNTLDIYGRLQAQVGNDWERSEDSGADTHMGGRLGISMSRALSAFDDSPLEGTRVVGKYEWQVNTEKYETNTNADGTWNARYAYLGLSNKKYGDLLFGRTQNPLWQAIKITYKYMNWVPNTNSYLLTRIDNSYQFNRQDGTIQWNFSHGNHLFEAAYVMGNGNSSDKVDDGTMASYRYTYKSGDITLIPVLAYSDFNASQASIEDKNEKEHQQIIGGLDFYYGDLNIGFTANHQILTDYDNSERKFNGFDGLVAYDMGRTRLTLGYSSIQEVSVTRKKEDWRAELRYRLASQTYLSATYLSDRVKDENSYVFGLRFYF
ncbi:MULTISPECIES: porin [Gammaproteobacteria]|uniref:Putative porin n=1 Tax=Gallaecimonas pentaromativorans TaxID=584787 RepID=A0A3N1NSZ1_9GAMM|nr:porin [Gallaecimonas pentaromativorans]ROQ21962.1 putative porin [Gallaecimonas pentaromativorans]